nr:hypothetical protein [uncultured Pseudomonas sp.]
MQKRANLAQRAVGIFLIVISLAGVLIEPCSGVEPSVPSVRVVNFDGAVRVVSAIAFDAAKSPEG